MKSRLNGAPLSRRRKASAARSVLGPVLHDGPRAGASTTLLGSREGRGRIVVRKQDYEAVALIISQHFFPVRNRREVKPDRHP